VQQLPLQQLHHRLLHHRLLHHRLLHHRLLLLETHSGQQRRQICRWALT
jgi:hypothetical protein